jgi:hypothetical protein
MNLKKKRKKGQAAVKWSKGLRMLGHHSPSPWLLDHLSSGYFIWEALIQKAFLV